MFSLEGDFFDGVIPPSDLYILARIIHDWKDDKNLKLLKKIHSACNTGERGFMMYYSHFYLVSNVLSYSTNIVYLKKNNVAFWI